MLSSYWNLQTLGLTVLKTNVMSATYILFKSSETVLLYLMKPNCWIYCYIPNHSFFIFYFWFIKIKKHLGLMDHPLMLTNPSLMTFKTNGIFHTGLLSLQYWLGFVWIGSIQYVIKAGGVWIIFDQNWPIFFKFLLHYLLGHLTDI